jgi:acetyl esterase/lipase
MYELFFYAILLITTGLFVKSFIGKKWWKPRLVIGKILKSSGLGIIAMIALVLWSMKVLEATAPRGSLLHEAVRLPKHFYTLAQHEAQNLKIEEIRYGEHPRQYMLVCESAKTPASRNKIVFYVHGGGWHVGAPEQHFPLAEKLAAEGYTVIMPAYRLGPVFGYDALNEDMTSALKASLNLMETQGWCGKELVLGGTSAGSNLAALLLYDRDRLHSLGLSQGIFAGFFSLAGALDIEQMDESFALENYAGACEGSSFDQANPVCHMHEDEQVPVLCIHGTADGLVKYKAANSFVGILQTINPGLVELHAIPDATHIEIATKWYYSKKADYGQGDMLLNWLNHL